MRDSARLDMLMLVTLGVRAARAKRVTTVDQVSMCGAYVPIVEVRLKHAFRVRCTRYHDRARLWAWMGFAKSRSTDTIVYA